MRAVVTPPKMEKNGQISAYESLLSVRRQQALQTAMAPRQTSALEHSLKPRQEHLSG